MTTAGDVGRSLRVRVTARNTNGTEAASSAPTAVIAVRGSQRLPRGSGPINVQQLTPPARLLVDGMQVSPNPVPRSTQSLLVRFHVSACGGRSVSGALVYVTAVPYNQFGIPPEASTAADGWGTMQMQRLSGFPVRTAAEPARDVRAGAEVGGASSRRHLHATTRLVPPLLPPRRLTAEPLRAVGASCSDGRPSDRDGQPLSIATPLAPMAGQQTRDGPRDVSWTIPCGAGLLRAPGCLHVLLDDLHRLLELVGRAELDDLGAGVEVGQVPGRA